MQNFSLFRQIVLQSVKRKNAKISRKNNEKFAEKMQKIRKFHDKNGNYAKNENFAKNKCKILAKIHQKY